MYSSIILIRAFSKHFNTDSDPIMQLQLLSWNERSYVSLYPRSKAALPLHNLELPLLHLEPLFDQTRLAEISDSFSHSIVSISDILVANSHHEYEARGWDAADYPGAVPYGV